MASGGIAGWRELDPPRFRSTGDPARSPRGRFRLVVEQCTRTAPHRAAARSDRRGDFVGFAGVAHRLRASRPSRASQHRWGGLTDCPAAVIGSPFRARQPYRPAYRRRRPGRNHADHRTAPRRRATGARCGMQASDGRFDRPAPGRGTSSTAARASSRLPSGQSSRVGGLGARPLPGVGFSVVGGVRG